MTTATKATATTATQRTTIAQIITTGTALIEAVNRDIYAGKLPPVVLTIEKNRGNAKDNGFYEELAGWNISDADSKRHQMTLASDGLYRKPLDILGTILHLMVHHYITTQTAYKSQPYAGCVKGRKAYHTEDFKREAELHGLTCNEKCDSHAGYGLTEPNTAPALALTRTKEYADFCDALTLWHDTYDDDAKTTTTATAKTVWEYTDGKAKFYLPARYIVTKPDGTEIKPVKGTKIGGKFTPNKGAKKAKATETKAA